MKTKNLIFALFFLGIIFSCQKEGVISTEKKGTESEVYKRIIAAGFNKESIVEYKDYFLVDGDIMFSKNLKSPILKHMRSDYLCNSGTYTVYVNTSSFPNLNQNTYNSNISYALEVAVWYYNSLNTGIQLEVTTDPNASIYINNSDYLGWYICGSSEFPDGSGAPGHNVLISDYTVSQSGYTDRDQLVFLLIHEMGHAIGLMHTNEPNGIYITGTPSSDSNSVMNSGTCGNYFSGFSSGDETAISTLYPL